MLPINQIQQIQDSGKPAPLTDISFSPENKILVLAPHLDDFDEAAVTLRYFSDLEHSIQCFVRSRDSSTVFLPHSYILLVVT